MPKLAHFVLALVPTVAMFAQDSGPAIASRGEVPVGTEGPRSSFRPFLETAWTYDTRLPDIGDGSGTGDTGSSGVHVSGGLSAAHTWRKTSLGLEYRGSVDQYTKSKNYNSYDQSLALSASRRLPHHMVLTLKESAGMFSRYYGLPGETLFYDSSSDLAPGTSPFDRRMIYVGAQADLMFQMSKRVSFNVGAQGNLTRRRTTDLYGVTGGSAHADMQYRATRRSTLGVNYSYSYFTYRGISSNTGMHGVAGTYSVKLARSLELSVMGGVLRSETFTAQEIKLSPIMMWLFGTTTITATSYQVDYVPNVNGRLTQTFRHGNWSFSGGRTVTPGNGLFLTAITTNVSAGYNYTGFRRWSLGLQGSYGKNKSIGNLAGYYASWNSGGSVTRQIAPYIHAVASVESRRYDSSAVQRYHHLDYYARVGLAFAPGDIPLRLR